MRQFAFYLPELNIILFFTVMFDYQVPKLEWGWESLLETQEFYKKINIDEFDFSDHLLVYLGEV